MLSLKHKYLQDALAINGYFTIPFLDNCHIEALKNIFSTNFDDQSTTFYATSFHPDFELKKKISDEIIELLHTKLEEYFFDFKILGSSFLKKKSNENNPLPLHQDWTVTDEEKYGSFTIWIPLQDTFKENGAIRLIPGSHLVDDNFRAPSLPVAFEDERAKFESHLITLPLKSGEAFVFNQKLMHASWPNKSTENRLALTIGLVPKAADLFMLYFDKNKNALSKFEMPTQMFLHYPEIIEKPLIGQLLETKPFKPKKLNYDTFKEQLYLNRIQSATMQPLFKDENQQHFFQKNGYIKIPVLEANEIDQLKNYLFDSGIKKENDYGFYVAMDHDNKELVAQMMDKISTVALPKLTPHLADYQLITASYVIKDPNPKGVVPPHQDWTFVEDETKHCSVTCWIALVDTDMDNGCMGVIKGSHKFFNSVRPSPSPQVPSPLAKHMFSLFPYFELLPMKAGEALIFDNRTFHSSPPNITSAPRLAVGLSFTQKEAELRHYFLKPGTKDVLLKYKIDPQFFMKYDNGKLAKMYDAGQKIEDYELMEEVKFHWEDLSKEQMKNRVLAAGNEYNKELTTHMMKLFGDQMKSGLKDKIMGFLSRFLGKKKIEKKVEFPKIFNQKYTNLQAELDLNGYVKVDLLDEKTLSQLLEIYENNPKPNKKDFGFHLSVELEDNLEANKIAEEISSKIKGKTEVFFVDYKYISPRFAVKEPNSNSLIPPHQDWTFVDESKFQSYNLWIALVDIDETNGTLGFLKGSHKALNNDRGVPLPFFKVPFHEYASELVDHLEFVNLKAGEAVLFNSRTIHGSKSNVSEFPRISIAVELTNKLADLKLFYLSPTNGRLLDYEIDSDFYSKYSNLRLTKLFQNGELINDYKIKSERKNEIKKIAKNQLLKACLKPI